MAGFTQEPSLSLSILFSQRLYAKRYVSIAFSLVKRKISKQTHIHSCAQLVKLLSPVLTLALATMCITAWKDHNTHRRTS